MTNKLTATLLPTEDASQVGMLTMRPSDGRLAVINVLTVEDPQPKINQHLHLVSDAPIKGGNWYLDDDEDEPYKATEDLKADLSLHKIEFTTDPKLIADGVGKIDGDTKAIIFFEYNICVCSNSRSVGLEGYKYCESCGDAIDYKKGNKEVNFLIEFCKRWNEKSENKNEDGYNPYKHITAYIRDKFGPKEALAFHIKFAQPVMEANLKGVVSLSNPGMVYGDARDIPKGEVVIEYDTETKILIFK